MYNLPSRYPLKVNHNWVEGTFEKFADQENMRKHSELPRPGSFQGDDLVLTFELLLGSRRVVLFGVFYENPYWHAGGWPREPIPKDVLCSSRLLLLIEQRSLRLRSISYYSADVS
jgi:hypothetical protein